MKNHHFPLFILTIILFLLAGVVQVSARAEVPGGMMGLGKNKAATSTIMVNDGEEPVEIEVEYEGDGDGQDIEPAIYVLPDGEGGEIRRGIPARVEQMMPLHVQERRQERSEVREAREEKLRSMNRSERATERMSDVAKSVQELLANPDREGGIGKDIREIARQQQNSQEDLEENLSDVNERNRLFKLIVGVDGKALGEVKKEASQIDGRIAKLKALSNSVQDEEEQAELNTFIEDLEGQRNDLLETVEVEDSSFSMVGWMRRLFGQK